MLKAPKGGKWGKAHIHIKGVPLRFGFDSIRTSQTLRIVKNKATGTPLGMYNIRHHWLIAERHCAVLVLYMHQRGAFSVARFDNPGNAKAFIEWNE